MPTPPPSPRLDGVLLRTARADDDADLIRLAGLGGRHMLPRLALRAR